MNVLLVDDEPLELEQLEYLINPLFPFWKLYKASDSCQAVAISQKVKIHLAFLDINLPGKSGLELGEELRQHNPDIELIIVTAYQNFHYAKQSIRLGVVDYMTKPVIQSELVDILGKYRDRMPHANYSHVIYDALTIIHEKFADKLSLADIAAEVHINPTYLSRRFHDEVGVSFSEYLMQYRIDVSKKYLIAHPDWSISTVAEKAGFNSQHYFCTIFRKSLNLTPKEYREREK
ncbi:AraC family transcriptional regulator [Paenibacillus filicis]|uniref:AraC family transcriptional regulator n=1 Tax=Paenibacillus gyeongsangnamensis TaxID=3388067 RepID=A0ABT4QF66_9BACL|nr:AraC family transcriptional regulator [Paenibacillus filicis]MCZ8515506.1 AraC family transcriptional regulator [Paenibacillus filicis]